MIALIIGLIIGFQFDPWLGIAAAMFAYNCQSPSGNELRRIITEAIEDAKDEEKK